MINPNTKNEYTEKELKDFEIWANNLAKEYNCSVLELIDLIKNAKK
jgi:hypothetical protein